MIAMVLLFTLVCFIAGYIVTLCDVAYASSSRTFVSSPAPAPAGSAVPNPAKSGPGRIWKKIKSGATLENNDIHSNLAYTRSLLTIWYD